MTYFNRWANLRLTAVLIVWVGVTTIGFAADNPSSQAAPQKTAAQVPGLQADRPESGRFVEVDGKFMVPYRTTIPGTDVSFEMVPISGGTFTMGSPESEADRSADEGPMVTIKVEPFWMGKHEVTWEEYERYMSLDEAFKNLHRKGIRKITEENEIDGVTAPSELYDPDFTYDAGEGPRQPAATMTQFAAKQYTKWLSLIEVLSIACRPRPNGSTLAEPAQRPRTTLETAPTIWMTMLGTWITATMSGTKLVS